MCLVFEDRGQLPSRRVDLYQEYIEIWLRRWRQKKVPPQGLTPRKQIPLLEHLALAFFPQEEFAEIELLNEIERYLQDHGLTSCVAEVILDQILQTSGLLVEGRPGRYLFLHLTFQEYLAACVLAKKKEWLALVKPHLFDPRWEEVIRLLASKLEDATPLIQAIWQEQEDICFGRLLLAGKCLVDAQCVQEGLREKIIKEVLTSIRLTPYETPWSVLELEETRKDFEKLLGMLAATYDAVFQELMALTLEAVRKELLSEKKKLLIRALGATRTGEAVQVLVKLLRAQDLDSDIPDPVLRNPEGTRYMIREILGEIGGEEVVPHLLEGLRFGSYPSLVKAVGQIGREKAVPDLVKLLNSLDLDVRREAARALIEIEGEKAVTRFISLLSDSSPHAREIAAWALGEIRSKEAVPYLLKLVGDAKARAKALRFSRDPDWTVRYAAIAALGKIGTEEALRHLLELLALKFSPFWNCCDDELEALAWALGESRAKEAIPDLLELAQKHRHVSVRLRAVEALGRIGDSQVIPHLVALFMDHVKNPATYTYDCGHHYGCHCERCGAARSWVLIEIASALGMMRSEKEVFSCFFESLQSLKNTNLGMMDYGIMWLQVLEAVVVALGAIRSKKAVPSLLDLLGLLERWRDSELRPRAAVAWALGQIGGKEIMPHLISLLSMDPKDELLQRASARALGLIGDEQAIRPLYGLAQSEKPEIDIDMPDYEYTRHTALRALRAISRKQGIRILLDGSYIRVR